MGIAAAAGLLSLVIWQLFQRRAVIRSEEIQREVNVRIEALKRENYELKSASKEATQLALERLQQKESASLRERELAEAKAQIEAQIATLEAQRAELTATNAELAKSLATIELQQEQLIASEKLAVLGRLAASITHEINSPIGAIKGITQSLEQMVPYLLSTLPMLTRELPEDVLQRWIDIRQHLLASNSAPSPREQRKTRLELAEALRINGLENAEDVADQLAKAGFTLDSVALLMPLLQGPRSEEMLSSTAIIAKAVRGLRNIRQSVDRTQRIVSALRHAVHERPEDAPVNVPIDLEASLESVLALYTDYTNQGIAFEKSFAGSPTITGDPQALAQVWTNLLLNAIQALQSEACEAEVPTLQVCLQSDGSSAEVTIADNGPGIPEELQARVFEQFFTTKAKGEGTGLGLAIVKDIVTRHGGTLTLQSMPGNTQFTVRLPLYNEKAEPTQTPVTA